MITKEEYKRNLIRMFDSLRTDKYKGEETCEGVSCSNCPFYDKVCSTKGIKGTLFHSYEAIEVVERWARKHPIVTNADKFREVFGTGGAEGMCICQDRCEYCKYYIPDDGECGVQAKFWNAEYKEQAKEVKENRK